MSTTTSYQSSDSVFVVLNPNAGRKQGREQFKTVVEPALKSAGVPFQVIETQGRYHARDYFKDNTLKILTSLGQQQEPYNDDLTPRTDTSSLRIMVLGGDGTVHEIVNGILSGLEGLNLSSEGGSNLKVFFSVLPLGTGNAIATSLGISTVQEALGSFLMSPATDVVPMRVMTVSTRAQTSSDTDRGHDDATNWKVQTHTVVVNSFGMHCATVYDGDGLRFLGNERFKLAALKNLILLKQYPAKVNLRGPVQKYDRGTHTLAPVNTDNTTATTDQVDEPSVSLPGPFTYLMITKQASLEPGFTPTPFARTSDDWLDILAVQSAGRGQILNVLGAATKEGHQHVENEKVEYYKAKVVEMETPIAGRLCIDGEFMHISPGSEGRIRIGLAADRHQLFHVYGKQRCQQ
ncbi:hypothetical protein BGZ83_002287 [Gryganskiella cystojenkinii]|nr:hypothetical protein BGZ83_002287 [Gryganskiella cystojenkinii]